MSRAALTIFHELGQVICELTFSCLLSKGLASNLHGIRKIVFVSCGITIQENCAYISIYKISMN